MGAIKEPVTLYEGDFLAWTEAQADALKRGDWRGLDIPNLVEEIEAMGRQQRAELTNRLAQLLAHLFKWKQQTALRARHANSWEGTITEQRRQVARLLQHNPSLKPFLAQAMVDAWGDARAIVAKETGIARSSIAEQCPFAWDDAMREDWTPE